MSAETCPYNISQLEEPFGKSHEKLIGLRARVDPSGASTSFAIQFTNQSAFRVHVPFEQIPGILSELQYATNTMMTRQRLVFSETNSAFLELIEGAEKPIRSDVVIDPTTLDRILVFQFEDKAAWAVRLPAVEQKRLASQIAQKVAVKLH